MRWMFLVLIMSSSLASPFNSEPKTILLASGFEGVVIHKNWPLIIKKFVRLFGISSHKTGLISLLASFEFWKDIQAMRTNRLSFHGKNIRHLDKQIQYLLAKYPVLRNYEYEIIDIFTDYFFDEEIIEFFKLLKIVRDYPIYIETNKNRTTYHLIKKKLTPLLQKQFGISWSELFNGVFYEDKIKKDNAHTHYTHKPKPTLSYFRAFIDYIQDKEPKADSPNRIILIDHKMESIEQIQFVSRPHWDIIPILYDNLSAMKKKVTEALKQ